jgi:ArsR family transcriptional regulator, arsenate/arsenite/antimonite-responsive transcriptional repressor
MVGSTAVEVSVIDDPGDVDANGDVAEAVLLLTAVADPNRLTLLRLLTAGPMCVCELQAQLPIAANLLSYHLKVLREAGLIAGTRRGRWVDYSLQGSRLDRLRAAIPALPAQPPALSARRP